MATGTTIQQIVDVVTPAAGESVTEGTILEWHVKVGEPIKVDDTIVEISTDKVDVELPSPASGTVTEILAEEGDTVTVGQVIARIAVGAGAAPAAAAPAEAPRRSAPARRRRGAAPPGASQSAGNGVDAAPAEAPARAAPQEADGLVDVLTPAAGESVSEGTILEWHVKVGEPIKANDTIVEISTDKVDLELPSPATGTVTEILVEEGDTVTVGQVIARDRRRRRRASAPAPDGAGNGAARRRRPRRPTRGAARCPTARASRPSRRARRRPRAWTSRRSRAAARAGGSSSRTCSTAAARRRRRPTAAEPAREPAGERPAAARAAPRCSRATWSSRARSRPPRASARSTVTVLDGRRRELKAAGRRVSFTHLIAYAIARAAERDAGHDQPLRGDRRQAAPHRRRPGQPRPRRRRREEGRHAHADGAR